MNIYTEERNICLIKKGIFCKKCMLGENRNQNELDLDVAVDELVLEKKKNDFFLKKKKSRLFR